MLFKLLKYDFRAMWKSFAPIWGAALALALVNRLTLFQGLLGRDIITNSNLLLFVFFAVIIAMFVLSILFVVQRFSKGLLGNEGYLMHTLPVRPWELVASKLICGTVTWILSGIVACMSPFIMAPLRLQWTEIFQYSLWKDIFIGITKHPDVPVLILEFCLMVLSVIVQTIAAIYLAISISHLFPRFRRLAGGVAFIGLYVLLLNVYSRAFSAHLVQQLMDITTSNVYGSLLTATMIMLIPAGLFLAVVCWILEHKLNLE